MKKYLLCLALLTTMSYALIPYSSATDIEEYAIHVGDERWILQKSIRGDMEAASITFVAPDGTVLDEEGFKDAARVKLEYEKIDPALLETINLMSPDTPIQVVITFKDQPYGAINKSLRDRYRSEMESLRGWVESVKRPDSDAAKEILAEIKSMDRRIIVEAYAEAKKRVNAQQMEIALGIQSRGGKVHYRYTIINALSAVLPAKDIPWLSDLPDVARIWEDRLLTADLNVSIPSIFADTWWANGFEGGMYNVGIIDSGMDTSHPAFSGVPFVNMTFHTTASTNPCYNDNPASADDLDGHGTHVGGIVISQGAAECIDCVGVAPGLNAIFNLKAAWRNQCTGGASLYNSDAMAAVDWAESQTDGPDVYNMSYGGPTSSDDSDFARFLDAVVSTIGHPVTLSAGNSGPDNLQFTTPATAYNALAVANMDDRNTINRSTDVISNSSTRGPTASGRKKPDIAAPGARIGSAYAFWETDFDFADFTGTSMAAPHLAGAFLLLQDYMGSGVSSSLKQKALLINTADAWSDKGTVNNPMDDGPVTGKHWDGTYGWGYINLQEAYNNRDNVFFDSLTGSNTYKLYKAQMSSGDKATVVWNRRALYNNADPPATWHTLSDIDLYLRREDNNVLLDSSQSGIDNIEQVVVGSMDNVVVKVKLLGSIDGETSEPYGLAADGNFSVANFDVGFLGKVSPFVCPNTGLNLNPAVMNLGDTFSHDHTAVLVSPSGWTQNTSNPRISGSLQPNRRGYVTWNVTSPASGTGSFSLSGTSGSYGETITIPTITFDVGVKSPSFSDVPCNHPFYGWIEKLKEGRITSGCAATLYCPDSPVTRVQMAVFLIKAIGEMQSAVPYNTYFDDIADDIYARYINRMYELKITAGCGIRAYCPDSQVTRGQMSAFISRATGWTPFFPANPTFADVPNNHSFFGYIEKMWRNGITNGCSASHYCPDSIVTRGQMAVFIVRAFLQ